MENGDDDNNIIIVGPPITIYFIAGCVAGAIESIATWPTEYIKTKLQLQKQRQDDRLAELVSPVYISPTVSRVNSYATPYNNHDVITTSVLSVCSVDDILDDPPLVLLPYSKWGRFLFLC